MIAERKSAGVQPQILAGRDRRPAPAPKPLPFNLRLIRAGLNTLGRIAPPLAGRWAYSLFMTPPRFSEPPREAELVGEAERFSVPFGDRNLAAYSWGEGPTVLLVHGWSGRGAQLGAFVPPLLAAGYRVVAFDAPAHGRTPGRRTNALEVGAAVLRMGQEIGPLRAVIGHSFGSPVTSLALRDGLAVERIVLLAPACQLSQAVRGFVGQLGLSEEVETVLRAAIERNFGPRVWHEMSVATASPSFRVPALLFHDPADDEVPFSEAEAIAASWPGARLVPVPGAGHRRILRDETIVAQAVEFIRSE